MSLDQTHDVPVLLDFLFLFLGLGINGISPSQSSSSSSSSSSSNILDKGTNESDTFFLLPFNFAFWRLHQSFSFRILSGLTGSIFIYCEVLGLTGSCLILLFGYFHARKNLVFSLHSKSCSEKKESWQAPSGKMELVLRKCYHSTKLDLSQIGNLITPSPHPPPAIREHHDKTGQDRTYSIRSNDKQDTIVMTIFTYHKQPLTIQHHYDKADGQELVLILFVLFRLQQLYHSKTTFIY
ncbi:hypothetical protein KUTeg_020891 [Tegillarca granosa]|uniref:Uncharacterized protein n=1 Tax=Tegillarca granosa TaxID=220873 RepID=A0ABQ9EBM7_TEGGR|nr:hypothetical protein KUTeg_020891 [Tegillarca granosa]